MQETYDDEDGDLVEQHARCIREFEDWEQGTYEARQRMHRDLDYYDGNQWDDKELQALARRGQPPIVKNHIAKKINFLHGMEIRNRMDPRALPRTPAHDQDADAVTDALRYVVDDQDFDMTASECWRNVTVPGIGGGAVDHEIIEGKDQKTVRVLLRGIPWDRIWYDIHSRKPDFSDAAHIGITIWEDYADAVAFCESRDDVVDNWREVLDASLRQRTTDETHDDRPRTVWSDTQGRRKRIRRVEKYYRRGNDWWVSHYTSAGFLVAPRATGILDEHGRHECPVVLTSCYVDQDGMRYGLVRNMIGPQDELNKRSSKSLHLLSVNKVVAEEDALLDVQEALTENAKPDGAVIVQRGALADGRVIFQGGSEMAQGHIALMQEAKMEIDTVGPEIPQIGSVGSNASGRSLLARQQIGQLEITGPQDHFRRWKLAMYRRAWHRIRQMWPEETWLRVRDDSERTGYRFVALNRPMTRGERVQELLGKEVPLESALDSVLTGGRGAVVIEQASQAVAQQMQAIQTMAQMQGAQQPPQIPPEQQQQMITQAVLQHPLLQERMIAADVANLDMDIVLDETPDTTILQQEEYEQLTAIMPSFLQAGMAPQPLLELVLEASQLRSKRKLLQMVRQPPDPKAVEQQEMMQQLAMAVEQAKLAESQSKVALNQAKAAETQVDAQIEPERAASEIALNKARAMDAAAGAGQKMTPELVVQKAPQLPRR